VVLNLEDELDGVSRRSTDTAWSETKISVGAANDDLNSVSIGRDRGGTRRARVRRIRCRPHIATEGDGIYHEGWSGGRGDGRGSIVSGPSRRWGVLRVSLELGADCKSSVLEVGEGVGGTISTTINGADHASSAMAVRSVCSLITEHPDWLSVVHSDGKGGPIRRSNIGTNWLETRVKTTIFEGTRASKRRLSNSVVLGVEVIDDLVARICGNCLRIENKGAAVVTNLNVDDLSGDGRSEDEADEWDEHD